jgi:hypothetical protein
MKTLLTALIVLFTGYLFAQDAPTRFVVHEDIVKPSKDALYKECMKKLKSASQQYKSPFGWVSVVHDDNSYIHLAPMKSFADLDKNPFAELESKMGKDDLSKLWADFDQCIESHRDFVVEYVPQLSYLSAPEGENYRDVLFWYPIPGNDKAAEQIFKEWKALYESKKSPDGYAVYKLAFGQEPGYAVVSWGKDEVDAATKTQKSRELLGEEAGKMWEKTQAITKKYYSKRGWILPDFSYSLASGTN